MDNITNFDKLIINLSSIEKKELLEKMEMTFEISQEPLVGMEEVIISDFQNYQQEYESLTIIQKIILFFKSLVKQKDIPTLLKEHKVNILRKKYFHNSDLADFKNSLLKQSFYDEFIKLKDPIRFFRKYLQKIFTYEDKQDFYAFIGGIVLPDLQQELLQKSDPWEIEKNNLQQEDSSIKSEIDSFLELKLDSVSDLDCSIMNEACQSLYGLFLLCTFDLNLIIRHFDDITPDSGKICKIEDVSQLLQELSGILQSLNKPPTVRATEALFLYSLGNEGLHEDLNKKMTAADTLLSVIRDFNKKIPLENLVKVLTGDLNKKSKKPPVVEDWFRIYKKFWNTRVNKKYGYFVNERKKSNSEKAISSIIGLKLIKPFDRYSRDYYWEGSPAKYEKSVAFIQVFLSDLYNKTLNPTLMIINRDGEFYKKDNKSEFDKALNYFSLLDTRLLTISHMVSRYGLLGEKVETSRNDDEEQRNRIISTAIEQVDYEVLSILESFIIHIRFLNKVMHGIVIGSGGAYDTLSNISSIGGRSNPELRETFKLASLIINKVEKYISEMKILEEK